jgi:hypothetical protein
MYISGTEQDRKRFLDRPEAEQSDESHRIHAAEVSELVGRCRACENPEQCELDLRLDPANPQWQNYCPNAATLLGLASG